MKGKTAVAIAFALLAIMGIVGASAATVQGSVFEWHSLEKINNAIIDINSTPMQRIIATQGNYSLQLPDGGYTLRAEYYENNTLKYVAEEEIQVAGDGNFTLDLIMFPADENELGELIEPGITDANIEFPAQGSALKGNKEQTESMNLLVALVIIVLLVVILLGFAFKIEMEKGAKKGQEKAAAIAETSQTKQIETTEGEKEDLDKYAREVLQALKNSGNRLTQKELRERVQSVGEAKISLIISELEAMGKIKKIKNGRENIIVLKEE